MFKLATVAALLFAGVVSAEDQQEDPAPAFPDIAVYVWNRNGGRYGNDQSELQLDALLLLVPVDGRG